MLTSPAPVEAKRFQVQARWELWTPYLAQARLGPLQRRRNQRLQDQALCPHSSSEVPRLRRDPRLDRLRRLRQLQVQHLPSTPHPSPRQMAEAIETLAARMGQLQGELQRANSTAQAQQAH